MGETSSSSMQGLSDSAAKDPVIQWVTFKLDGETYGINVMQVQEVLRHTEIAPVPGAPLNRRNGYREAFCNFDVNLVSKLNQKDIEKLMQNPSIIRNKLKINSAINNANHFIKIQKQFGTFDKYLWGFVNYKPIRNKFKTYSDLPPYTELSEKLSIELKKHGFTFVGPTICYAFMQAIGMVNDHTTNCFKYLK